jgi:hypothetical protein
MKFSLTVALMAFLSSCTTTKIIGIKGRYPEPPIITNSDRSFEKVWEKTVDYFAEHGIPIKIIDKSSGLIISDKTKLTWSFEKKDGSLFCNNCYVVLQQIMDNMHGKPFAPTVVTGEWNIRIKNSGDGSSINVNLYNIEATYGTYYYSTYTHNIISPIKVEGKTTGIFEKTFEEAVK